MKSLRLAAALLVAMGPLAASAQDASKGDVFAGYSMLATDGETMHGWHAALGWGLSGRFGLLLDVSGHQGTVEGTDIGTLSLMAGPRVTFGAGRLRPFLHVIGGVVRSKASVSVFDIEISESTTDFGGAAGGGFDIGLGDRWAIRLAGDYRVVKVDDETASDPRFSAGVAYNFGAR
jgi:Outer membrane protein beta-barrel domain